MNACKEWKNELVELAAEGAVADNADAAQRVEAHINGCSACAATLTELRAQALRLDAGLARIAGGAELRDGFEARVIARIAAGEMQGSDVRERGNSWGASWWSGWRMRLAAAGVVCAVVVATVVWPTVKKHWHIGEPEISITQWRSPTDSLLQTPGQDLLRSTPKLGVGYFPLEQVSKEVKK
jgi:hypothetical protein